MSYKGFLWFILTPMNATRKFPFSFYRGFLRGLAAPGDIFGRSRRYVRQMEDVEAMRSDWIVIGDDIREVVKKIIVEAPRQTR